MRYKYDSIAQLEEVLRNEDGSHGESVGDFTGSKSKKCIMCQKEFTMFANQTMRTCSDQCWTDSEMQTRKRNKAGDKLEKICPICKSLFFVKYGVKYEDKRACNRECGMILIEKNKKARSKGEK